MMQTIRVAFVPVDAPLNLPAYHMAIIYDEGDGTAPQVVEAGPSIPYRLGNQAQDEEGKSEIGEALNPFSSPRTGEYRSPFGFIRAQLSNYDKSFDDVHQEQVASGDDLSNQWNAIVGFAAQANEDHYAYLPALQNSKYFCSLCFEERRSIASSWIWCQRYLW
jgi:hypothetical protein